MGGANQYRYSCSKRVTVQLPSFNEILSSFMLIGTMVIELVIRDFKEEKKKKKSNMDKMDKL